MLKEELELQSWALESAFGGTALGLLVVYKHRALARMAESCLFRGECRETLSWTHIRAQVREIDSCPWCSGRKLRAQLCTHLTRMQLYGFYILKNNHPA